MIRHLLPIPLYTLRIKCTPPRPIRHSPTNRPPSIPILFPFHSIPHYAIFPPRHSPIVYYIPISIPDNLLFTHPPLQLPNISRTKSFKSPPLPHISPSRPSTPPKITSIPINKRKFPPPLHPPQNPPSKHRIPQFPHPPPHLPITPRRKRDFPNRCTASTPK